MNFNHIPDHLLSLIVGAARESAMHWQVPQAGDLVVATLECPRPNGVFDPNAIGYLVGHGDAPLNRDGTGPVREVWDVRALSDRTHGGMLCLRWENVDFAVVSPRMVALVQALIEAANEGML